MTFVKSIFHFDKIGNAGNPTAAPNSASIAAHSPPAATGQAWVPLCDPGASLFGRSAVWYQTMAAETCPPLAGAFRIFNLLLLKARATFSHF